MRAEGVEGVGVGVGGRVGGRAGGGRHDVLCVLGRGDVGGGRVVIGEAEDTWEAWAGGSAVRGSSAISVGPCAIRYRGLKEGGGGWNGEELEGLGVPGSVGCVDFKYTRCATDSGCGTAGRRKCAGCGATGNVGDLSHDLSQLAMVQCEASSQRLGQRPRSSRRLKRDRYGCLRLGGARGFERPDRSRIMISPPCSAAADSRPAIPACNVPESR